MLWKIGLPVIGGFSILYYAAICLRLRKWNSTFSRFWLVLGAACLSLTVIFTRYPRTAGYGGWRLLWTVFAVFAVAEGCILSAARSSAGPGLSYIIVLGAQVSGRTVTDSLCRRLRRACTYLDANPKTRVIVSGGKGTGEDAPEAEVMKEYLLSMGIPRSRIICEDRSTTTRENLEFSAKYVDSKDNPVGIVTNNFHIYRACGYAKKLGYSDARGIAAGCNPLLLPNYLVREFFAVLKFWIFF